MRFVTNTLENLLDRITVESDGCWRLPNKTTRVGYVRLTVNYVSFSAHRYFYECAYKPIPVGLVCDHLCKNRWCCNPEHVEIVTQKENVNRGLLKKTHCKRGHLLDDYNLYPGARGRRDCLTCKRMRSQAYSERKKKLLGKSIRRYKKTLHYPQDWESS